MAARGRHGLTVWAERDAVHLSRMARQRDKSTVGGNVPEHDTAEGGGGEYTSARAECDASYRLGARYGQAGLLMRDRVPQQGIAVGTPGGEHVAVTTERDAGNGPSLVPDRRSLRVRADVPEDDLVEAARGQELTVRCECGTVLWPT